MVDANDDSAKIAGPAVRPSQASSPSGLGDEERKRELEQSRESEAKNRKIEFKESNHKRKRDDGGNEGEDESRQCHDEAMVGEFEVNQEADDFDKSNELEEYQEDVYDGRTGELLDAKLTIRAESEKMSYMEQLETGFE